MSQGPAAGSRVRAAALLSNRNCPVYPRRPATAGWLLAGALLFAGPAVPEATAQRAPLPSPQGRAAPPLPAESPPPLPLAKQPLPPDLAAPPPSLAESSLPPLPLAKQPLPADLVAPPSLSESSLPSLTLAELLAAVDERNPRLRGLRAQVRAASERPAQVATLDDPTLMIELWQVPWDGASVPLMFTLRQPLPWPGKLRARAATLVPEAARARAEAGIVAVDLRLQACRSYYGYRLAVRSVEVLRRLHLLLDSTVAAVAARYRSGQADLVELLKAQEAVVNLDNQLLDTERERDLAIAALNTLRGEDPQQRLGPPGSAATVRPPPEATALLRRALAQRPELLAAQAAAAQARARTTAAKKERAPELAVWTSLMKDLRGPQDTFTVGVQTSIPSFSLARYGAAEREARAQGQAAQSELQAVQLQIRSEVQQAVLRLLTTGRHLALHSGSLIPLSEQAARAAEAGFQSGKVSLAQLLDTARMLSEHHLEYERYQAEYGQRWAELEAAIGGPLLDEGDPGAAGAADAGGQP